METMAASRHTSAKADGSPLEFGECGLCLAASRSHRRGPRWQTEGVENLSGYGGILDGGQNAHPRVASRAFQNIQCEHPRHQLSPRIIARARILLFCSISMSARFSSRNRRRGRDYGRPLLSRRSEDSKIADQMETRRGHEGREFLDQFTITHDHVRRAVAPRCFHPIREAAAGKTLQTLDSQWRPQHIPAQIFQLLSPMCRQTDIRMNAEPNDMGATPGGWFRLLGFSAATPGSDAFPGVRSRGDASAHSVGI